MKRQLEKFKKESHEKTNIIEDLQKSLTNEKRRVFDSVEEKSALEDEILNMREELREQRRGTERTDVRQGLLLKDNKHYEGEVKDLQHKVYELDERLIQSHRDLQREGLIRTELQNELEIYTEKLEESLDEIKRLFKENNVLRVQLGEEPQILRENESDRDLPLQETRRKNQKHKDHEASRERETWESQERAQR